MYLNSFFQPFLNPPLTKSLKKLLKISGFVCLGVFLFATPALAQDASGGGFSIQGLISYFQELISYFQSLLENTLLQIQTLGPWGPIALIAVYIIATVAFIPGSLLTLGAGALFGLWKGVISVFIGASLGATAAFLVGRYLARGWVAKKIEGNATFSAIDKAVEDEGLKIVSLTRLSPVFPFTLLNYAFGITSVSLRDYVLGFIGMIPGTFLYTYLGSTAGNLAQLFAGGNNERSLAEWIFLAVGLIATFFVTVIITRTARKALDEKLTEQTTQDA